MVKKNDAVMVIVEGLRAKAQLIRDGKDKAANDFIEGFEMGAEFFDNYGKAVVQLGNLMVSSATATKKIIESPVLRTMTARLVSNIANDFSSRINELSNLLEATSKDETVTKAMDDVEAVGKTCNAAFETMATCMQNRAKKSNLHAVPDPVSDPSTAH